MNRSGIASEYNRGCFSTCSGLLAGILGGATAAVVFAVISIVISILACVLVLYILSTTLEEIDRQTPGALEEDIMLTISDTPHIIRINVLGGILTMNQSVNLDSLQFTPDPYLEGKPIRLMDAHRKYGISERTICNWANTGLVRVIERGPKLLVLEESSVARAIAIFKQAEILTESSRRAGWVLKKHILTP